MTEDEKLNFEDTTALISGASRGIGEAVARELARCGARVIITSRKIDAAREVADSIESEGGLATPMACHLGHPEEIEALFETISSEFGALDILINNGATNPWFGPAVKAPEWAFDKTFSVNVKGWFQMAQQAARMMIPEGRGAIINVASIAGLSPIPEQLIYSMTKAAIIAMTKGLARELGPHGIRVNAVAPGIVETRFAEALTSNEGIQRLVRERTPLGRWAQAEEIVGSILFLASDLSTYTTGSVLVCDGGMTV